MQPVSISNPNSPFPTPIPTSNPNSPFPTPIPTSNPNSPFPTPIPTSNPNSPFPTPIPTSNPNSPFADVTPNPTPDAYSGAIGVGPLYTGPHPFLKSLLPTAASTAALIASDGMFEPLETSAPLVSNLARGVGRAAVKGLIAGIPAGATQYVQNLLDGGKNEPSPIQTGLVNGAFGVGGQAVTDVLGGTGIGGQIGKLIGKKTGPNSNSASQAFIDALNNKSTDLPESIKQNIIQPTINGQIPMADADSALNAQRQATAQNAYNQLSELDTSKQGRGPIKNSTVLNGLKNVGLINSPQIPTTNQNLLDQLTNLQSGSPQLLKDAQLPTNNPNVQPLINLKNQTSSLGNQIKSYGQTGNNISTGLGQLTANLLNNYGNNAVRSWDNTAADRTKKTASNAGKALKAGYNTYEDLSN